MLLRSFYGRHACFNLTLSTGVKTQQRRLRLVPKEISVERFQSLFGGSVGSAELPSTQPCKTRFRIPLILKLV